MILLTAILLYVIAYVKLLLPSSQLGQITGIVVAGELLLVELLYLLGPYRRGSKPSSAEKQVITEGSSLEPRASRLTVHHIVILFSIVTFDLFLLVPAYIVTLPELTQ